MKKLLIALTLLTAVSFPAAAQKQSPPEGGPPKAFHVPTPQTYTLPNGMKVTMLKYGSVPKVTIQAVMRVGNLNEPADQVWLADFTGNLMKEGSATRDAQQIAKESASMGARGLFIGVGSDESRGTLDVLSEFGPKAVALLADVLEHPAFPASQADRLKNDLKRQLSVQKSQPQNLAQARFAEVTYPNHAYGRYFPTAEMIDKFTAEAAKSFYNEQFGAARTHLYVVGQFDEPAVKKAINDAFAGWKKGPDPVTDVPKAVSQRRLELIEKPGAVQSSLIIGLPVIDPSNPDYVPLRVMDAILGGSFGSRITSNIREQKGYTYSPGSGINTHYRTATWAEFADVTTAVTGPSLKEIFYEIDRLQKEPPTADELKGIQAYMSGIFVLQNSTRQGIIGQLSFADLHGLGPEYLQTFVQKVNGVTTQQVQELVKKYLDPNKMTIVVVGDKEKIADQIAPYQSTGN
jgi:predicted Zn-dependent peptidase